VHLALQAETKPEVLRELVSLLRYDPETERAVLSMFERREALGSTGIGRGIAVPHCRTPIVPRLRVIYARRLGGVEFDAIDGAPVEHFFVLIAPPVETSNAYLPVLGRIARLASEPDVAERLKAAKTPDEFLSILAEKKV
jgi:mannitol/fructose-specific phosphotransferase system IIA component (Ntr-type)